ncbi:MAG: FAD-binding oxidoreductase [Sandaracinaceae bacterium]|nr:FAD-binding oxidoreductase [Sandaracinaceae bacterium]MDW8246458.1 FAD-binding oxidoreductase [Sandaracinaceae bacterium]
MVQKRDELRWNGWGRLDRFFDMGGRENEVWRVFAEAFGVPSLPHTPPPSLEETEIPPSRATQALIGALGEVISTDRIRTTPYERAFHAYGRSYHDLLRLRSGKIEHAPDVVVYPCNLDEVLGVLKVAERFSCAVIPFGGGTSVVGGVEAKKGDSHEAIITLDTTLLSRFIGVDPTSLTATAEAGIDGPDLENALSSCGYFLGHYPQSFEHSTLGGWIASRSAGQLSNRYGTIADMVVSVQLATPSGVLETKPFPASAAGPDLNALISGSEGTLGVITKATLRVHRLPECRRIDAFLFRDFWEGVDALRSLVQEEVGASLIRLSDPEETKWFGALDRVINPKPLQNFAEDLLNHLGYREKSLMLVGFEGKQEEVERASRRARAILRSSRGLFVGEGPGRSWWKKRFHMPYLRDPMLDHGLGIDTLETASEWSHLPRLYEEVCRALRDSLSTSTFTPLVLTHISHSYHDGASLYFTWIFLRDSRDPIGQWKKAKHAASFAIVKNHGTISHHHGVGIDHAPFLVDEKGKVGMQLLEHIKRSLDPHSIMNPGKLMAGNR